MSVEPVNGLRGGARVRPGASVAVSVLLVVLVIAAAGLAGTSHLTGARAVPHFSAGDHHRLNPPHTASVNAPPPQRPRSSNGSDTLRIWVLIGVIGAVALGLAALLWRWLNLRRSAVGPILSSTAVQSTLTPTPVAEPEPEVLLTGIERALRALDEPGEPGDAIVQAWLGLEETAQESGVIRGASETPTEFTSRMLAGAFADDLAIATLLRLYLRTRFGDHPPTAADVVAVRGALVQLVASSRPGVPVTAQDAGRDE